MKGKIKCQTQSLFILVLPYFAKYFNKYISVPLFPFKPNQIKILQTVTHRNQSTAMMRLMSSVGSPTEVSTITMVTRPA